MTAFEASAGARRAKLVTAVLAALGLSGCASHQEMHGGPILPITAPVATVVPPSPTVIVVVDRRTIAPARRRSRHGWQHRPARRYRQERREPSYSRVLTDPPLSHEGPPAPSVMLGLPATIVPPTLDPPVAVPSRQAGSPDVPQ